MDEIIKIKSISQVHNFFDLPKPKHPLVSVIRLDTKCSELNLGNKKFALDLFQITLKSNFSGTLKYGRNSYDFQEGTLVFTAPNQVISFNGKEDDFSKQSEWTIMFHPDLIRTLELSKNIDEYSFFSYDANEALHLSDIEKKYLLELVERIENEISLNFDRHTQKLIISSIELLLDYCMRYYDRQFYTRTNLNKDVVSKFQNLLKSYYNSDNLLSDGIPTVKYCGEALNISPNYLSDLLKKETGRSAQDHIHFYIIELAKNNLLSTTNSISQIAYNLGFKYPQHFSKIFKSKVNMSPTEYRNLN